MKNELYLRLLAEAECVLREFLQPLPERTAFRGELEFRRAGELAK